MISLYGIFRAVGSRDPACKKPPLISGIFPVYYSVISLFFLLSVPLALSQPFSNRIANYKIDVRLDPKSHSIDASEILNWHNESDQPVGELFFHLYNNAYKSERTTYMRENDAEISSAARGWIDIDKIVDQRTESDITAAIKFVQPDDNNPHDSTVILVKLDKPVAPHDSISLMIYFHSLLPEANTGVDPYGPRAGWAPGREFYFVAQWFPKVGVYSTGSPGESGRWNCHQFHGFTEFFADFGAYDVQITVPVHYTVGACGERLSEDVNPDGTATYRYVASDVHDFAWTASPDFLTRSRTFKYPGLPETKIILMLQPEHRDQEGRFFADIDTAMKYFGTWYGPYPYPNITVVDAPRTTDVGGMEYPTLIAVDTKDYNPNDVLSTENVIVHEFGHQYWYGMVANNEFEEAWLDEGMNTYSTGKILEKGFGANTSVFRIAGVYPIYLYPIWNIAGIPAAAIIGKIRVHNPYDELPLYLKYAKSDAISEFGYNVPDYDVYETIAYDKPALVLHTLEGVLGPDVMAGEMRTYFNEFKFKHPTSKDFQKVCEQVSGKNLDWFFSQFIYGTNVVDFAVKSISYYRETNLNTGSSSYVTKVVVARNGEVTMPVDLRLSLEDDVVIDTVWSGQSRWQTFEFRTQSAPEYAQLDPWNKIPIDIDYSNNSLRVDAFLLPVVKWVHAILNYFQNMLLNVGVLV